MNRKIEFRGKCSHCDAWAYGSLVDYGEDEAPEIHGFDPYREGDERWREITVDQDTVGQFTGLVDKNGVKIFEGDIVRTNVCEEFFEVIYDAPDFCLNNNPSGYRFLNHPKNFEVIGNIYDNPELLATK